MAKPLVHVQSHQQNDRRLSASIATRVRQRSREVQRANGRSEGRPVEARVLSALGPPMLALAAARSAGTHPYLTVASLTSEARSTFGADALVAPEQTVVFDADPDSARSTARAVLRSYLSLTNYTTTMRRGGFTTADLAGLLRRSAKPMPGQTNPVQDTE